MPTISNEDLQALKSRAYNAVAAVQAQRQVVANLEREVEQLKTGLAWFRNEFTILVERLAEKNLL